MARKKLRSSAAKRKAPIAAKANEFNAKVRRQARNETLGAVAAVLGHEANNLLGALKTSVQILRKNPHLSGDDVELLNIVDGASRRLDEIVSEFADFSASRALGLQTVDLREVIEGVLSLLRQDERCAPGIAMHCRFDSSPGFVKADPVRLRQILWHLFLNAVQAMGDRGALYVETQKAGKDLKISVRDTGPGIPTAVLENMFEPLVTTKSRGVGLGLAIARRNVEDQGGQIKVQSQLGKGTCVTVLLPTKRKSPFSHGRESARHDK